MESKKGAWLEFGKEKLKSLAISTTFLILITHTDPFDRLLIAQAKSEKLTIATTDAKFKRYPGLKIIDVSK